MTKIPWTGESWNPVTGCTKISDGCKNCYAESIATRFWKGRPFDDVQCHKDRLDIPLHWRKARKIFVCSMSDLFHPKVPFDFIDKVMAVIGVTNHIYQILTKRPERMKMYFSKEGQRLSKTLDVVRKRRKNKKLLWVRRWPWSNIWLGASISTQADANKNIPILLQIPAAVRFVSIEPMLESVELDDMCKFPAGPPATGYISGSALKEGPYGKLNWVIVGCESGPKQRPCKTEWIRDIVEQCRDSNVPVFVKQVTVKGKCSKKPKEWPPDLRFQEYPAEIRI